MYIVTGGAGFIGSAFLAKLNEAGVEDIIVVDEFKDSERWKNLRGKRIADVMHKDEFLSLVIADELPSSISAIVHLGACSSTTEKNFDYLLDNNYRYSVALAEFAKQRNIRFVYASSAATYGDGSCGYCDQSDIMALRPLNGYGFSKQLFDQFMLRRKFLPSAVGVKFFNVFGPNEYHKGEMLSVVYKAWSSIKRTGEVPLFKSYRAEYADGEQRRDFVYVKDCCEVLLWMLRTDNVRGIYNLGTGVAQTWRELVGAVFTALELKPNIRFVDMPENLREQYQYYTCAEMQKLKSAGCPVKFTSLQEAVSDYVLNYLEKGQAHL